MEDWQSRIAWQTINEVSRRKSTAKAKLKATNQEERIMTQSPELLVSNLTLNLDRLLLKNSTQYSEKLKIVKPQGLMKFPQKYGKPDNLMTYCSDTVLQFIIQI